MYDKKVIYGLICDVDACIYDKKVIYGLICDRGAFCKQKFVCKHLITLACIRSAHGGP